MMSLLASSVPEIIDFLLPALDFRLGSDASMIVRDHATDALGAYGATRRPAAEKAYPLLKTLEFVSAS